MLVKGHNQLNIAFFVGIVGLELLFKQDFLPTIEILATMVTNKSFMVGHELIFTYFVVFFAFTAGAHFPDLDFNLKGFYPKNAPPYIYHRTRLTHWLLFHTFVLVMVLTLPNIKPDLMKYQTVFILLYYFELGVFTHLIGDMITGSIPFLGHQYVKSELKLSRFRMFTWLANIFFKLFKGVPKFLRYFVSPIFLVLFLVSIVVDFPIIILSILFEQKLMRIGSKVVDAKKFEEFWMFIEPWVFGAMFAFLFKISLVSDIYINFGVLVLIFIILLNIEIKIGKTKFGYNPFIETFERNFNTSFFVAFGITVVGFLIGFKTVV